MNGTPEVANDADEKTVAEVYKRLLAMIRVIRDRRQISIPEAIQRYGGPGIEAEYRRVVKELHDGIHPADLGGEAGGA